MRNLPGVKWGKNWSIMVKWGTGNCWNHVTRKKCTRWSKLSGFWVSKLEDDLMSLIFLSNAVSGQKLNVWVYIFLQVQDYHTLDYSSVWVSFFKSKTIIRWIIRQYRYHNRFAGLIRMTIYLNKKRKKRRCFLVKKALILSAGVMHAT